MSVFDLTFDLPDAPVTDDDGPFDVDPRTSVDVYLARDPHGTTYALARKAHCSRRARRAGWLSKTRPLV